MTTYTPTGKGLCAVCGRDVGAHDPGHRFEPTAKVAHMCGVGFCYMSEGHPIHDVGRTLTCPSEITNLDRVTIYPEVSDDEAAAERRREECRGANTKAGEFDD